ncbi:MAG: hypothetical protein ISR65_03415 [Bacteriovoracaceae bacterium]|nr:hypothetical protein [Bacteriovoracaceae bacterium]
MVSTKAKLNVDELKDILETYHNKECWTKTQEWFEPFKRNNIERAKFLTSIMYTPSVLTPQNTSKLIGDFNVLQGDIIKTKAAITNNPVVDDYNPMNETLYVIIPSSCSVQPGRYKWVLLARLSPIGELDTEPKRSYYENVLKFKNGKVFFFPPIKDINIGPIGFYAIFEEISYIENSILQSSLRVASLSEIGWHLLNAFIVNHLTRPSNGDYKARATAYPREWSIS